MGTERRADEVFQLPSDETGRDVPPDPRPSTLDRRAVLLATTTTGVAVLAGCSWPSEPSSGGPAYETREVDDGAVFGPGLGDETERDYYAALVVTDGDADAFDRERLPDAGAAFVEGTDFGASYLGVVQVGALDPSTRFDVVDLHESDVTLAVNVAVRDDEPSSEDPVITTLLLRVSRDGGSVPDGIAVELDVGDHHETFSGSRP